MRAIVLASSRLLALLQAMRPAQWIKNGFVLAPLFFSGRLTQYEAISQAMLAFAAFCAAASSVYLINDLQDRRRDSLHTTKRMRPIASGALPPGAVVATVAGLVVFALLIGWMAGIGVAVAVGAYLALNFAYSAVLKHIVIVDVFCVAAGFVLRVQAGAIAVDVPASAWMVLMTFLLAVFLALGKRRQELKTAERAAEQRPVLERYTVLLVDELMSVVTPAIAIAYIMYTLDIDTVERFGTSSLYFTAFPVIFGIFRYLYLVHVRTLGESPTDVALSDWPLIASIAVWIASFFGIIYLGL